LCIYSVEEEETGTSDEEEQDKQILSQIKEDHKKDIKKLVNST